MDWTPHEFDVFVYGAAIFGILGLLIGAWYGRQSESDRPADVVVAVRDDSLPIESTDTEWLRREIDRIES